MLVDCIRDPQSCGEACENFDVWVCCQLKSLGVTAENLLGVGSVG